ncbi:MAG: hypothetical protein ABIL25_04135 [candidate division WOR-3 bacterium]
MGEMTAGGSRQKGYLRRGRTTGKVSSGIYFYRLETPGFRDTRKAVMVR